MKCRMLGAIERLDWGGESEEGEEDLSCDVHIVLVDRRVRAGEEHSAGAAAREEA